MRPLKRKLRQAQCVACKRNNASADGRTFRSTQKVMRTDLLVGKDEGNSDCDWPNKTRVASWLSLRSTIPARSRNWTSFQICHPGLSIFTRSTGLEDSCLSNTSTNSSTLTTWSYESQFEEHCVWNNVLHFPFMYKLVRFFKKNLKENHWQNWNCCVLWHSTYVCQHPVGNLSTTETTFSCLYQAPLLLTAEVPLPQTLCTRYSYASGMDNIRPPSQHFTSMALVVVSWMHLHLHGLTIGSVQYFASCW